MSFCINCGSQLPENASFCTNCGAAVNKSEEHHEAEAPKTNTAPEYQQNFYENKAQQEQKNYQQPIGTYRADVPRRDLAICIILSIVTCGIYGIYWYYKLINELNVAAPEEGSPSAISVILLSIITCGIYGYFWLYKAGNRIDNIRQLNGEAASNFGLLLVLFAVLQIPIASYSLIQNELNKVSLN